MIIALIALLGTAALVMDVGFAWYAKRQIQASTDAAALAGAQQLPDTATATQLVNQYASLNTPDNLSNVVVDGGGNPTYSCTAPATTAGWCGPGKSYTYNKITVTETATTPTWFASVLGFNHFNVKGTATACQPCSSSPVDIMLVVDRTGSMCQPTGSGGTCLDLNNAKDGVKTLLGIMDPDIDTVGLVAFPPYDPTQGVCGVTDQGSFTVGPTQSSLATTTGTVDAGWYDSTSLQYLDDPLLDDFKTSATAPTLNPASTLVQHMVDDTYGQRNCIQDFGSTSYADALQAGYNELVKDGRTGVPKIIVFMTDGEANEGSFQANAKTGVPLANHGIEPDLDNPATNFDMSPANSSSTVNPGDAQPCQTAINTAKTIKDAGVTIYTIGYSLADPNTGDPVYCTHGVWGQVDGSYAKNATDWSNFKCAPIGAALQGPYKNKSWASYPWTANNYKGTSYSGFNPGHFQGGSLGGNNPCDNGTYGDHLEEPPLTSYQTLSSIATPTPSGGTPYFYSTAGNLSTVFASIAADITKGTSRLIDPNF